MNANQVFNWIKDPRFSPPTVDAEPNGDEPVFLPVEIVEEGAEPHEAAANTPSTSDVGLDTPFKTTPPVPDSETTFVLGS